MRPDETTETAYPIRRTLPREQGVLAWWFVRDDGRPRFPINGRRDVVRAGDVHEFPALHAPTGEPGSPPDGDGLYASREPHFALMHMVGPVACRVRLSGEVEELPGEIRATRREIVAVADATETLLEFERLCRAAAALEGGPTHNEPAGEFSAVVRAMGTLLADQPESQAWRRVRLLEHMLMGLLSPTEPWRQRGDFSASLSPVIRAVMREYPLAWDGVHGPGHWARVLENGLRLAGETGANAEVVALFAALHDARRVNEGDDPEHGPRAAEFARSLQGKAFNLPDDDLERLCLALAGHTSERTHPDVTIQTCWDADRLDLGRVGIIPDPDRLCTTAAREPGMMMWSVGRSVLGVVPALVRGEWGIDPESPGRSVWSTQWPEAQGVPSPPSPEPPAPTMDGSNWVADWRDSLAMVETPPAEPSGGLRRDIAGEQLRFAEAMLLWAERQPRPPAIDDQAPPAALFRQLLSREDGILAWWFATDSGLPYYGAENHRPVVAGEVQESPLPVDVGAAGLHASRSAADALAHIAGLSRFRNLIVCRVRLWGEVQEGRGELSASHREILAAAPAGPTLRAFAAMFGVAESIPGVFRGEAASEALWAFRGDDRERDRRERLLEWMLAETLAGPSAHQRG